MGGQQSAEENAGPGATATAAPTKPADLKQVFDSLDDDHSGTLDRNEITKALKQQGKSDDEIRKRMSSMGSRASINFEEFKIVMEGKELPPVPAAAAPAPPAAVAAPPPEAAPKAKAKGEDKKEKKEKKPKGEGKDKGKGKDEKAAKGNSKGKPFTPPSGPTASGGFRLNVKNLADDIDDAKLKEMFDSFGNVTGAQVKRQDNGKSRGFGFVVFASEEEGKKAIADMNDKEIGDKKLAVAPAERREVPADGGKGVGDVKGKGKGKGGKGGKPNDAIFAQQQAMAAAYMQQYQQYYYLQQMAYYQQQQGGAGGGGGYEYEGSIKSISGKNGYGFIVCAETHQLYQRDVYVDQALLPEGAKVADRVKFTVELNAKNHPRAVMCKPAL